MSVQLGPLGALATSATSFPGSAAAALTAAPAVPSSASTQAADTLVKLCLLWSVLNKHEDAHRRRTSLYGVGDLVSDLPPRVCHDIFYLPTTTTFTTAAAPTTTTTKRAAALHVPHPVDVVGGGGDDDDDDDDFFRIIGDIDDDDDDQAMDERERLRKSKLNKYSYKYSSRSLSVIGALGGIVFILFVVALSTCIKHRRQLYLSANNDAMLREGGYSREILLGHIRHIRAMASARSSSFRSTGSGASRPVDPPPCYEDVVKVAPVLHSPADSSHDDLPSYHEAVAATLSPKQTGGHTSVVLA